MAIPTQQEIDSLLNRLTSNEDKRIFLGIQALLIASQTQSMLYARALNAMGSVGGSIGLDATQAATRLDAISATGTQAIDNSLQAVKRAYSDAAGGLKGGMAAAEEFLQSYKDQEQQGSADAGELFKAVASGILNVAFPGSGALFNILV